MTTILCTQHKMPRKLTEKISSKAVHSYCKKCSVAFFLDELDRLVFPNSLEEGKTTV